MGTASRGLSIIMDPANMADAKRTYNTVQDLCSLVLQQYVWPIALSGV